MPLNAAPNSLKKSYEISPIAWYTRGFIPYKMDQNIYQVLECVFFFFKFFIRRGLNTQTPTLGVRFTC